MRISKCSILLIILFTFLSAYVSRIVELITVDYEILAKRSENNDISGPFPDDTLRHVIWFLQVSDLHISQFIDPNRIQQFREFCKTTVRSIKPHIVLATGDLTDAKTGDFQGSRQFIEEWRIYAQILTNSGVLGQTTWLDIRGNHDNFNVPSINSTVNYYSSFSVQGKLHPRSYLYQFNLDNDSYHFIGVDACLDPGPRRPFNFVGILKEEDMSILKQFEESSRKANATIWFGHYPTASILSPYPGIRYLMRNAYVYLCGHFHTLGGLVPNMYTLQQTGNLELELADWKESRMYRMAAIDHGLFSFVDTPYNSWPVILITNPKNALYNIPSVEPLKRILQSTHVRILVFSVSKVNKVEVQINNGKWQEAFQSKGPLYVLPWQPHKYITGIHTIRVKAQDSEANEQEVSQSFSLDGSQLSFRLLPRILLMSNMISLNQALFGFFLVLSIVPLCIIRILHKLVLLRKIPKPRFKWRCGQVWIKKFWVLISIDRLFYPLLLCALYVPIGPWFIGEILEDHIGICFAFGTFVGKTFLPGGITFAFGSMHLLTFQIPLTICLAHSVDYRYQQLYNEIRVSFGKYLCHHIPFLLLLTFNLWIAYTFFLAYGILAFVLGPLKTWTIILCLYLWHQIVTLPEYYFDQVRTIFPPQRSTEEHIPLNTNS